MLERLDHPVLFLVVITIGVMCTASILTWGFKALNLPGPAALVQHP